MHSNTAEYREFVEYAASKYRALASQAPSPSWANDAKRLAQATGEALMTSSFEVQDTHLFTDLKLTHERVLKLMAQHMELIDSENNAGNRFSE
jgi:hypothetical protein